MTSKILSLFGIQEKEKTEELILDFHKYYLETNHFVRTTIYWMVRSSIVDDLVQETYLKAWKSFKSFNHQSSFKTWIYRVAVNTTYDYLKQKRPKKGQYEDPKCQQGHHELEIHDLITKGLNQMSFKHREVFILFFKLEMTISEISHFLNISEGTAKSRIHYAKKQFIEFLNRNGVHYE